MLGNGDIGREPEFASGTKGEGPVRMIESPIGVEIAHRFTKRDSARAPDRASS